MQFESVNWLYDDMDAARRLWPRVKKLIEKQLEDGQLALSLADHRRVITAVVNDLLEAEKAGKARFRSGARRNRSKTCSNASEKTAPTLQQQVSA